MWTAIITFIISLIQSKKNTLWGTIIGVIGVAFIAFTYGYINPLFDKITTNTKSYNDSVAHEEKFKETLIIRKLEDINENIRDLKDDNKEIKNDIKDILRKRH